MARRATIKGAAYEAALQRNLDRGLSPAYAARLARGEAAGKSPQASRGHKPREHVERKAKEIARGGLTTSQKQAVKRFAEKQAERRGKPWDIAAFQDTVRRKGWDAFVELRTRISKAHRDYKAGRIVKKRVRVSKGSGRARVRFEQSSPSVNWQWMDDLSADWELPDDDMMFYH